MEKLHHRYATACTHVLKTNIQTKSCAKSLQEKTSKWYLWRLQRLHFWQERANDNFLLDVANTAWFQEVDIIFGFFQLWSRSWIFFSLDSSFWYRDAPILLNKSIPEKFSMQPWDFGFEMARTFEICSCRRKRYYFHIGQPNYKTMYHHHHH